MSTESVDAFAKTATLFVDFAEEHSLDLSSEVVRLESVLANLYAAGVVLKGGSRTDAAYHDDSLEFTKQRVRRRFQSLPFQYYTKVFNPHNDREEEIVTADLIEDLVEVYSDVKEGLQVWNSGKRDEAVWKWRESFYAQWGRHVLGTLFALHTFCEQDEIA